MSGHSKWSQIKHKKAASDAKKGVLFGKLARAIALAARDNPDPTTNQRLRDEIARARSVNMPNGSIERALKRVADRDAAALSELQLEFIGPANTAIIVNAITDNSNRTVSELRQIASRHGAHAASPGSVSWMFKRVSVIRARINTGDAETLQLVAIDAGADDVELQDNELIALVAPENGEAVAASLGDAVIESSISLVPTTPNPVTDSSQLRQLEQLVEALDNHDDVQDVTTNANTEQ